MVTACTIVARNYLPHARVLTDSFLAHHPDGEFFVLVIDDETRELDTSDEKFRPLRLGDIGLTLDQIGQLAGIYDVTELATAVKPPLLRWLLSGDRDSVIYLDPDIKIFAPLEDVARLAMAHDIVLTPHTMMPVPRDNRRIDGLHILGSGVYNLGFIALGRGSTAFIDWWWDNTRREALMDHQRMMFTDQRWIDFVPSFFQHHILKHPGYNVAYWNLHGRDLRWTGERYDVDGETLHFFHFSGFDHRRPYLLSKHQGETPRILLSERPDLSRICGEYRADLEAAGIAEPSLLGYGWSTLPNGFKLDQHARRLYWSALVAHEREGKAEPPNPFDPQTVDRFMDWLNQPGDAGPRTVSRYLHSIYLQRPDLQQAFPDLSDEDLERFFAWIRADGIPQEQIDSRLLPPLTGQHRRKAYASPDELESGVNVAGYLRAELGIGEAARLMLRTLDHAGVRTSTFSYDETSSRQEHAFTGRGDGRAVHDVNLICVNADRTPHFARDTGRGFFKGRHNVGYWFWELEHFPETMYPGFAYVDEVWCATRFITDAVASTNQRPVYTVPVPVPIPETDPSVTRESLGLPDRFVFLFVFDFFSIIERKNPIGLVRAFCQAFRPDEGPVLLLKTINGHKRLNDLERLNFAIGDRTDIRVVDEYYSAREKNALVGLADCYVSLHRSEGLGLTMAEAMGLGKPVIATGYSGNLDFMSPENSFLVDYSTAKVPPGCEPYTPGSSWAAPSIDSAAEAMRRVVQDPSEAARRARLGQETIVSRHGVDACAPVLLKRLDDLRARGRQTVSTSSQTVPPSAMNQAAPPPVDETLRAAATLLTPTAGLPTTAKLRGLRLRMQDLLLRALRPYWWQQRTLNETLIQAIRGVNERRAADAEALHAAALAHLGNLDSRLTGSADDMARRVEQAEKAVQALAESLDSRVPRGIGEVTVRVDNAEAVLKGLAGNVGGLQDSVAGQHHGLARLEQRVTAAESSVQQLGDGAARTDQVHSAISTFQQRAAEHLADLTTQVGEVATETRTLSQRLYASPYVARADALSYTDDQGRPQMGFVTSAGKAEAHYREFEDLFRGDEAFIRDRFRAYLPLLRDHGAVLDVGCGRGELLELLRSEGLPARGVDLDLGMIERCRAKGLDVTHADALEHLRNLPEGTQPTIVAAQFIEHIPYEALLDFLGLCHSRLAPGGLLIAETVNPHSLEAFKTFWTDLSHQAPIFPEVALALCRLQGYSRGRVVFPQGNGELEHDRMTCGEYAVVATK